jgi:hypothetical protein
MIALLGLAAPAALAAQLQLTVDDNEVAVGDVVQVQLQVVDGQLRGVPELPSDRGLQVRFRGQSQSTVVVNFETTRLVRYSFEAVAVAPGRWTLGPVDVVVDGEPLSAGPVSIEVREEPAGDDEPASVEGSLSATEPWEGQLLVHRLSRLRGRDLMRGLNVYVDSPMAVHGIESLYRHPEYLAPELTAAVRSGGAPLWFPELHYVLSKRESMAIDRMVHGGIILAGSGFMDAGPMLRHLEESIDRPDCLLLLGGYQPEDGFASRIERGADRAQFNGKTLPVRAKSVRVEGLSGHADQDDLLKWFGSFGEKPSRVVINHGVDSARTQGSKACFDTVCTPCRGVADV